ncbi:MAG: amidase [Gemmatimonadaceae bacterium]|jgi:amidase|nr:amidase [Gemmatimonadaceae bacterium]
MDRRDFVRVGAVAGALAMRGKPLSAEALTDRVNRPLSGKDRFSIAPFALEETTIADLQSAMVSGRMTARSITQQYLDRIQALDRSGPTLRAILEINPDALSIADTLDRERKAGKVRGPLHGIPILIKDNIDTADRMTTTAGSYALAGSIALQDATIAAKLRTAGAILLGKTNLSEWANFRSTHSSSGWSGRGGQARNPYVLDRNPCGSSSGTGAAISANMCAVGIGTETDGSIVCPSSVNGIVGIKPTLGLVSRAGIIPIAHSQDTAGPMTRTVRDAAILLGVLAGTDPRDSATSSAGTRGLNDYTKFLDPNGLRGARIGVARTKFFGYSDVTDKLVNDAIDAMKVNGAVIVDPANIETAGKFDDTEFDVLLYEFKADLNKYLESLGPRAPVKSLADIIAYNEAHKDQEMPYFGQEIMIQAQAKGPLTEKKYLDALASNLKMSRTDGIDATMDKYKLDAIVAPTGNPAWPTDLINGDHFTGASSTPAAVAGYPNINVPAGLSHGLPVGISFFGRAYSEPTLIKIAYAYEQATKQRRAPQFIPTLGDAG